MRFGFRAPGRGAVSPRPGLSPRRLGRAAVPRAPRPVAPRSPGRPGVAALVAGAAAIVLGAALLALLSPGPEAPSEPHLSAPSGPTVKVPRAGLPPVHVPSPGPLSPPGVPIDSPSAPDIGLPDKGDGGNGSAAPVDEGPEHRNESVHVHNRLWLWDLDWVLLTLVLIGIGVIGLLSRAYRLGQRVAAAVATAMLLTLSVLSIALGIHQEPGPGTYHRNPPEVERSSDLILTRVEIDHYHAPTHLDLSWLLAGICLAGLAIGPGRTAVAPSPKRRPAAVAR